MKLRSRIVIATGIGFVLLTIGAYAAVFVYRYDGKSAYIGLRGGPAQVTARELLTPAGEVGTWHYHPGYVYNVVTQGTITIEDGCRGAQTQTFGVGQAFETSEGRVHRAVNNGTVDEVEY